MSSISSLISKKSKYRVLKSNVNLIISNLNYAIENLEIPSDRIKEFYSIDSISVDKGSINSVREDLINKINFLKNVVNRIDVEIRIINREIDRINSMDESM